MKLTVDSQVKAINYSIDTVNGHIFIMGIAQDQKELDRVLDHARDVSYVRRVTSHAVFRTTQRDGQGECPARQSKARV